MIFGQITDFQTTGRLIFNISLVNRCHTPSGHVRQRALFFAVCSKLMLTGTPLSGDADPLARADLRPATQRIYLINLRIDTRVRHSRTSTPMRIGGRVVFGYESK